VVLLALTLGTLLIASSSYPSKKPSAPLRGRNDEQQSAELASYRNRFLTALIMISPILIAVSMSFHQLGFPALPTQGFSLRWYQAVLSEPKWQDRLPVSLIVATLSALIATSVSTLSAFALVRYKVWGKNLISTLFIAPLIVPLVVLGTGISSFGLMAGPSARFRSAGAAGNRRRAGAGAHGYCHPVPFVMVRASLTNLDPTLERAATNLGASPVAAFTTITLPLIMPGVISGFIFAFITSWDEVVIASFLSTSRLSTVPVQIFQQLRNALDPSRRPSRPCCSW